MITRPHGFTPIEFSQWRVTWVRTDTRGRRSRRARRAIRAARVGQMNHAWWLVWRCRKGELVLDSFPKLGLVVGDLVRWRIPGCVAAKGFDCEWCRGQLHGEWVVTGFIFGEFPRVELDRFPRERVYASCEPDEIEHISHDAGLCRLDCFRNVR